MSLITVRRASADRRTVSAYSRCSRLSAGLEQQARHADDSVHRSANLVAHVGEKFALGLAGTFSRLFGARQLFWAR